MKLFKPGILILTVYGIINCIAFLYFYYLLSFGSGIVVILVVLAFCFIGLLCLLSAWYDSVKGTEVKRYFICSLLLFPVCFYIYQPIQRRIGDNVEKTGEVLFQSVKSYKLVYGKCPDNIYQPYFNNIPKSAFLNNDFHYKKYLGEKGDTTFVIQFSSFGGMGAYRYENSSKWHYSD